MKKHLLLGTALVAAIGAVSQNASHKQRPHVAGVVNMAEIINQKFAMRNASVERASSYTSNNVSSASTQTVAQDKNPKANLRTANTNSLVTPTSWQPFTGSMNIYGVLVSGSRPLQYSDELNAVSFIHRKSQTYSPTPVPTTSTAASGAIVAEISTNWGGSWDSTCVWADNNNWARYPQGGIINSPLINTTNDLSNAHVVITAPITQVNTTLGWTGSAFSWKNLGPGTYNAAAPTSNMTFISNTSPYSTTGAPFWGAGVNNAKLDFARLDFSSNDDGSVWAIGQIFDGNVNGTTFATQAYRGARLVQGKFVSGTMVWSHDSVIPAVRTSSISSNPMLISEPGMAWSEDGATGYVWHIGAQDPGTNKTDTMWANRGFQPIVSKTIDHGVNWQTVKGIDFNTNQMRTEVLNHLRNTDNDTMVIPFFDNIEGISGVVDANNKLHLVASIFATAAADPDSSDFTFSFTNSDGEIYRNIHGVPGFQPMLWDFTGDGSANGWSVTIIDTLTSEDPGTTSGSNGYVSNPWDATGGATAGGTDKVDVDARIQTSRTPDGKYIVYTWAQTDSSQNYTGNAYTKWNTQPNVQARMMDVTTGKLSPTAINVTSLQDAAGQHNNKILNQAFCHYASPRCAVNTTATIPSADGIISITLPMTVTKNSTLQQLNPVTHWYASTGLQFKLAGVTGIKENSLNSTSASYIYPNPAKGSATLAIDLKDNSYVNVNIVSMIGQVVKSYVTQATVGSNSINIDLNGVSKGIYMVNVKVNNASSTKKLIVE